MAQVPNGAIVVIDDDAEFRNNLVDSLEASGTPAVGVESGNHAIKFFKSQPWSWTPRLIITDLVMDGMGGFQLIHRISEIYAQKNIPVIVVSKLNTHDDKNEAQIAGAKDYLCKPVTPEQVIEAIKKATSQKPKIQIDSESIL